MLLETSWSDLFGFICPYPASLNDLLAFIKTCNYSFISTNMLSKTNSIKLECDNPNSIILMGHVCWQHFALHFDFTLFMLNGHISVFPRCFHFSVPVKLGISNGETILWNLELQTAQNPAMPAYITFLERTRSTQGTGLTEPHKPAIQGFPQQKPATAVAVDQTVTLKSWEMMAKEEHSRHHYTGHQKPTRPLNNSKTQWTLPPEWKHKMTLWIPPRCGGKEVNVKKSRRRKSAEVSLGKTRYSKPRTYRKH